MPTSLSDPVLALSLINLEKLPDINVDQLANLWNVFTKCKESIESGRRLENLSWRLWFREAHLLPPDTSLSEMTDYTPLDTPLRSRQGSVAESALSGRATSMAISASRLQGLPTDTIQKELITSQSLSDPEDGNWSDDGDEVEAADEAEIKVEIKKVMKAREEEEKKDKSKPGKDAGAEDVQTSRGRIPSDLGLEVSSAPGDRKRAVSSSSAFGSRARVVKQNTIRRRRPLSFQQAIESLILNNKEDFRLNDKDAEPFQGRKSASLREGMTDVGVETVGTNNWRIGSLDGMGEKEKEEEETMVQQSSAPAEFSQPNTPSISLMASPRNSLLQSQMEAERSIMPPPVGVPNRSKAATQATATKGEEEERPSKKKKDLKFFVAGQSLEDDASSSFVPSQDMQAFSSQRLSNDASDQPPRLNRSTSDAASDTSQRLLGASRGHTKSQHGGHLSSNRNRSMAGLSRGQSRNRGQGRNSSTGKGLNVLGNVTKMPSEHAAVVPQERSAVEQHRRSQETEKEKSASPSLKGVKAAVAPVRAPVKFTMGGGDDDDDDEDFTDDDSSSGEDEKKARRPTEVVMGKKKEEEEGEKSKDKAQESSEEEEEEGGEDDDEWSSDSSTDSQEIKRRTLATKKQEEEERQSSMFKKVPIKSASTADVRGLGRRGSGPYGTHHNVEEEDAPSASPPVQPVRGLLSSMFHPEEDPHPPPGQLAGRPHASAADLRRLSDSRNKNEKGTAKSGEASAVRRTPSSTQVPSMGGGGLKLSKSAVALPVLSTLGSRSEAKGARSEVQGSRNTAVFDDDEDAETDNSDSEALTRLNRLASSSQKGKYKAQAKGKKRSSQSSLNVEVSPEINEESMKNDRSQRDARQPAVATAAPLSTHRSPSYSSIPEVGQPQTPRTTRRNMLRDELSESLRQNLLWERQSRNRMMGIGAANSSNNNNNIVNNDTASNITNTHSNSTARSQSQVAPINRNHSVLAGGALRPLTASNSATTIYDQEEEQRRLKEKKRKERKQYTGDFHHAGW
ncbi:hypothetical protein CBS101457_006654 [Exobasidium rhododendri]|nr:hypothetical protein CBS101457_006654 [Exobasidium rhododendri]